MKDNIEDIFEGALAAIISVAITIAVVDFLNGVADGLEINHWWFLPLWCLSWVLSRKIALHLARL